MFLIPSCGVDIALGVLSTLVRFQFSICCGVAIVLSFAGGDGSGIAGVVSLGAVVMQAKPASYCQHGSDQQAD
jgi:hypothetical protein